ncbi:MAG: NAD(P)H-dependent glycerol-3-phosphate dehydrogenase [Desulfotomaculales bacterium]
MGNRLAILGAGSWGTALAVALAQKGHTISLWSRRRELAEAIRVQGENVRYLPGVAVPTAVEITEDLEKAIFRAEVVVFAVPSHAFREVLRLVRQSLSKRIVVVNAAKGLEEDSLYRLSQVFAEEMGPALERYVVLSGPSHAEEVGRNLPTAVVVASAKKETAEYVQEIFMLPTLRVYTNQDITGVELGGALKNIIALGTGIAEGLGFGDNTRAALMTRGLAEITRLGVRLGADPLTFSGLAGLGDLIVTCTSLHSRNRRCGIEIGRGKSLAEALAAVNMVVEGVRTTRAAYRLALVHSVDMPITEQTHRVLFENLPPAQAVKNLLQRERTSEIRM